MKGLHTPINNHSLDWKSSIRMNLKLRYSEKATQIWKNLLLCLDVTKYFLLKGDFFPKFCGLLTISKLKIFFSPNINIFSLQAATADKFVQCLSL